MATPTIGTTNGGPSIASTSLQSIQQKIAAQKATWEAEAATTFSAAYASLPPEQRYVTVTVMTEAEFHAITPNPYNLEEDMGTTNLKQGPFEIIADATKIILRQHFTKGYKVTKNTNAVHMLGTDVVVPGTTMYRTHVRGSAEYNWDTNSTPVTQAAADAYIANWIAGYVNDTTPNPINGYPNIAVPRSPVFANVPNPGCTVTYIDIYYGTESGERGAYASTVAAAKEPITAANADKFNVANVETITHTGATVDADFGSRDFTLSLSGITNNTTGQTQTRAPSSPATNPSRPSGRGAGRRPGSTNSGGSGTGFQSGGGTFYNSSTGTWGTQVISNDTISSSPYTDPIDGLNTSTNNDLTTSLPLTIPGNSFLIQSGSLGEIYPTYEGAYVWDIALKKWGKYKGQYKTLIDYSPINSGLNGAINYSNFGMHAGILDPLGEIYLFDTWPADSWIRYGKAGYYRLGHTEALELKVHFRTLDTDCVLRVDSSMNGRDIDPTLSTGVNILNENDYTFKFKTNGRWFYINLFGHWDLQFLELRGNITGRR